MDKSLAHTLNNALATLFEVVATITDHIDDPGLTEKVNAILFASTVEQELINREGKV